MRRAPDYGGQEAAFEEEASQVELVFDRNHQDRILAYIKCRLTTGIVEGINNRMRTVTRRSYGYH